MEVDGESERRMRGEKFGLKVRGGQPVLGVERQPKAGARWTLNRV